MGCPKLDDANEYVNKITQILKVSNIKSIKIVHMEVPCCAGLVQIVQQAVKPTGPIQVWCPRHLWPTDGDHHSATCPGE